MCAIFTVEKLIRNTRKIKPHGTKFDELKFY